MKKLYDLRFIIGLFFCIVGASLLLISFFIASEKPMGDSLNRFAGSIMLLFGMFMLLQRRFDKHLVD
ncbi:MAG: hypothetical protein AAB316_21660 [Bacteroidota bacterium]